MATSTPSARPTRSVNLGGVVSALCATQQLRLAVLSHEDNMRQWCCRERATRVAECYVCQNGPVLLDEERTAPCGFNSRKPALRRPVARNASVANTRASRAARHCGSHCDAFRTAFSAIDRTQLVIESVVHVLPVMGVKPAPGKCGDDECESGIVRRCPFGHVQRSRPGRLSGLAGVSSPFPCCQFDAEPMIGQVQAGGSPRGAVGAVVAPNAKDNAHGKDNAHSSSRTARRAPSVDRLSVQTLRLRSLQRKASPKKWFGGRLRSAQATPFCHHATSKSP